jgi:hypothetical protein
VPPVRLCSAPSRDLFGLDPAKYLVRVGVMREDDEALSEADLAIIRAAIGPDVPRVLSDEPPTVPPSSDHSPAWCVVRRSKDRHGLDPATYLVTISVERADGSPLSPEDRAEVKSALDSSPQLDQPRVR